MRPNYTGDQLIWIENSNGQYTVKSGYQSIKQAAIPNNEYRALSSFQIPNILWKSIWKLKVPPKIRFFLWSICQHTLPTKANLFRRHVSSDPECSVCETHTSETMEHLFFLCPWTSTISSHPQVNISILPTHITCIESWLIDKFAKRHHSPGMEAVAAILWQVWKERNCCIFNRQKPNPIFFVEAAFATSSLVKHLSSTSTGATLSHTDPGSVWRPPDLGVLRS